MQRAIADAESAKGGYNGIYFDLDAPVGIDLDPYWPEDYDEP